MSEGKKKLGLPRAIQDARRADGHTQLSLSVACDVTLSWLCHVESGDIRPGFERLGRIARELKADLNEWARLASEDEAVRRGGDDLQDSAIADSIPCEAADES